MMVRAQDTMHRIGIQLIEERRKAGMADMQSGPVDGIEGNSTHGRDILSVLSTFPPHF